MIDSFMIRALSSRTDAIDTVDLSKMVICEKPCVDSDCDREAV